MALDSFFHNKIESMKLEIIQGQAVLRRLEAQRNDYNSRVRLLREELGLLQQPGSYVGEVVKVMGTKKVLVKVHPEGKYVVDVSDNVDISKLTVGKRVTLLSDSYKLEKMLPSSVDPLVSLMMVEKVPDSTYDMIGGLDQQIKEIKEVIELGLKHPELFESLGIAQPKGVLLYGPPGTGKTLLARAVAHHTDCKFIRVSGSELVQKYIGEGSRMVRELFVMAREHAPSIIFMDEIDSIGSSRVEGSSGGDSEVQRTMLELLNQLDGFEPTKNIKVIMATNRLDILDPALLRPGRIDRKIEFPPPTVEARADILRIHSRSMNLTRGINLTKIAEKMNGCSGAELKGVCTEAGMYALRERRVHVTQEDFDLATAKVLNKHDDKEMAQIPFRHNYRKPSRQASMDPHNDLNPHVDHYIGIDVGTGSARALATENIGLWQPETGYYEQSTTDIWRCICVCVQRALSQHNIDPTTVRGIGFDATCSLAVFAHDTDEPVPVTGPNFANDGNDRNVILWLDHRPVEETAKINATGHNLLRYVGGKMSIEMEIPKVLWLKNHMPAELFDQCKFYDLADALTHLATGNETRSFCSTVCKQGYVPVGVDGSVKGWQDDFYEAIGLEDLTKDDYRRIGGVDGVNGKYLSAGELVGVLSEKAGQQLGLPAGIAVGSGVIDAYAGWVGTVGAKVNLGADQLDSGVPKNDMSQAFSRLAAVAGTSTCHLAMSKDPVFVDGVWGPYRDVLLPDFWMAEGGQSATGELLKHVLETHPAYNETVSLAESFSTSVYDYLNSHLEELKEKTNAPTISYLGRHFFFYGDLWGNRSPIADPNMTGSVIGLSSDRSMDGLAIYYYATMEFIAMQTRQIVEKMNESGHSITSIFMSGSQCQNKILMELMATTCDMPVLIPRYVHAAVVHGAAMLGAKAASADKDGKTEDLWSVMDRMSKPGKLTRPGNNANEKKLLDAKYKVFLEQVKTQQEYRKSVDDAVEGWA
ncbi:ribitol kinase [Hyaloscypha variabilis]